MDGWRWWTLKENDSEGATLKENNSEAEVVVQRSNPGNSAENSANTDFGNRMNCLQCISPFLIVFY